MAKQLYDYWFVQFDFPDENGKPYKSSGGKMVWNEKQKREIPEGWNIVFAKGVCPIITGKEDANFSTTHGQYPFFTCAKENLFCDTYAFDESSILIAGNGDFNVKHYTGKFNAYQRTYVLTPNPEYYACLFFAANSKIGQFKDNSNGSIIKFITKGDVENIELYKSENKHLYNTLNSLLFSIEQNNQEISSLAKLRDEMAPLLMNGQVKAGVERSRLNYDLSVQSSFSFPRSTVRLIACSCMDFFMDKFYGSPGIGSDKVSLLHNKAEKREGEYYPEGTKERQRGNVRGSFIFEINAFSFLQTDGAGR